MFKALPILALIFAGLPNVASANAIDLAAGVWGVDVENPPADIDIEKLNKLRGCFDSPVIISIDKDLETYRAVHTGEDNFTANAKILSSNPVRVSLQYENETRVMKNGEPQIWHMYFVTPDKFYWIVGPGVGEEQRDGVVTVARVRCGNFA